MDRCDAGRNASTRQFSTRCWWETIIIIMSRNGRHPSYFLRTLVGDQMEAAKKFLKYADVLGNVWILTASQVMKWMKDP